MVDLLPQCFPILGLGFLPYGLNALNQSTGQLNLSEGDASHPSTLDQDDLPSHGPKLRSIDACLSTSAYDDYEIGGPFSFGVKGDFIISEGVYPSADDSGGIDFGITVAAVLYGDSYGLTFSGYQRSAWP
jgi:hypothetical protein